MNELMTNRYSLKNLPYYRNIITLVVSGEWKKIRELTGEKRHLIFQLFVCY